MYPLIVKLANPFLAVILALGFALATTRRRPEDRSWRLRFASLMYLALYVYCLPVTSYFLCGSLEWQLPRVIKRPEGAGAIVVLGGGIVPPAREGLPTRLADGSLWRCHRAEELYHEGPSCRVFVIGGNPDGTPGDDVSQVMARVLEKLGIAKGDMVVETKSRNTRENAQTVAALLRTDNVSKAMLVTSALHLPRAARLFQEQQIDCIPIGCDYRTDAYEWGVFSFLPSSRAAEMSTDACREWLSTLAMLVRGTSTNKAVE